MPKTRGGQNGVLYGVGGHGFAGDEEAWHETSRRGCRREARCSGKGPREAWVGAGVRSPSRRTKSVGMTSQRDATRGFARRPEMFSCGSVDGAPPGMESGGGSFWRSNKQETHGEGNGYL